MSAMTQCNLCDGYHFKGGCSYDSVPDAPEPLSPSPEIRYQLRNWHHVTCAGLLVGNACTCLEQREALIMELAGGGK